MAKGTKKQESQETVQVQRAENTTDPSKPFDLTTPPAMTVPAGADVDPGELPPQPAQDIVYVPPEERVMRGDWVKLGKLLSENHTRALVVSHVPAEGETYDEGRRYMFHWVETKDGVLTLSEQKEVENGGKLTLAMPFHVAFDWVWKRLNDFLKPSQYR